MADQLQESALPLDGPFRAASIKRTYLIADARVLRRWAGELRALRIPRPELQGFRARHGIAPDLPKSTLDSMFAAQPGPESSGVGRGKQRAVAGGWMAAAGALATASAQSRRRMAAAAGMAAV